ncbi:hypothetical protein DPMN_166252 [Dreissena polymorpha]|uniref:Uncharacterized protein n=1 Tax=Dreissena polymorpha TaxID=45954 RepID=A0A9D4ITZ8_DREPO|nr:hypothetical protein DPMN_166252 [Dreissena polymorpha]
MQHPENKFLPPVKIVRNLNTEAKVDSLRRPQVKRDFKAQQVVRPAKAKQNSRHHSHLHLIC